MPDARSQSDAPPPRFAHLHLHTEYSLLDGGNRVRRLVQQVRDLGMEHVAITDHGNLFGVVEFYEAAKRAGIKPIIGIEAYVAPGSRTERLHTGIADGGFHLVLLTENDIGWRNLVKLSSDAYLSGFYYKPRMDKETLAQWSDGLIAINGHLGSSIAHHLQRYMKSGQDAHWCAAVEEAQWHAETFGRNEQGEPRFYIELQRIGIPVAEEMNGHLMRLAKELDLPLVCDNDAHFLRAEDWDIHDTLCCISMQKNKSEEQRIRYPRDLYVKSPAEMAELFADVPEAIENTVRIAQRCNVNLDDRQDYAPVVRPVIPDEPLPYGGGDRTQWYTAFCARYNLEPFDATRDSETPEQLKERCDRALRELCEAGLIWRYGEALAASNGGTGVPPVHRPEACATAEVRARLDRELGILADKNISAYFLIVWDFVNWARQQGIPALARGSGVGTMVGYVLGLSNACPVRYGLLFERFTDPDRSEYPDIDIDICQDGRARVLDYVRRKYGHVAQIITFGTLKARAAIKDVGRVLGFTPGETDRLCKLVPEQLNISLAEALEKEPELKREYDARPEVKRLIDDAQQLEGHLRNQGVHAAGVVIATQPLDTIIPLCLPVGGNKSNVSEGDVITQWDGPTVEKFGLLKMDFLGLRTLSTMERAKSLVREAFSEVQVREMVGIDDPTRDPFDLDMLEYDDPSVFELFQRGETAGIFQFESGGMRNLLVEMKPDRLEDLIAANALYRPGPMDLIPQYNRRKHGQEPVPQVHPIVDRFTAETYGVMVYQEQVMQICHELGGIPLRAAYTLIKAISKKKESIINAQRPLFIEGAVAQGLDKRKAADLFDLILKFAGYGFNKSHSTGYAIVAYQTAWLKTYFPNQYMAALLTFESQAQKVSEWIKYLDDCRRTRFPDGHAGIDVRPPDVNLSASDFSVVFDEDEPREANCGHVRFGLKALKGAGEKAVAAIVAERNRGGPYRSLYDFCERVPLHVVNKATIESLIKSGAFDGVHGMEHRAAMVEATDAAVSAGQALAADRAAGQASLFGGEEVKAADVLSVAQTPLPRVAPWDVQQALLYEKDVLGFFVSSHPLERWRMYLDILSTTNTASVGQLADGTPVVIAGLLTRVRPLVTRHGRNPGQKMAMITLEDLHGQIDAVLFSDLYATCGGLLTDNAVLFLVGRVDHTRSAPSIKAEKVIPVERAAAELSGSIEITLHENGRHSPSAKPRHSPAWDPAPGAPGHANEPPDTDNDPADTLAHLTGELQRHARSNGVGRSVPVRLHLHVERKHITLEPRLRVPATEDLLRGLRDLLGPDACALTRGPLPETAERRYGR